MTIGERIRVAREGLGLSQEGLAEQLGVTQRTVSKWELGQTAPSRERVIEIEGLFRLPRGTIEFGSGVASQVDMLPLMGHIEFEQAVRPFAAGEDIEYIEKPPGVPEDAFAALVVGDFMLPIYRDGNVLIWWEIAKDPTPFFGEICACTVAGGEVLIRIPEVGARGLFTLNSVNNLRPTMRDVRLISVSPIEFTMRRATWRRLSKPPPQQSK